MYYKLSNIAERRLIEEEFGIAFKHPKLYQPCPVINGFDEEILPVITTKQPELILYAIWGILPEHYDDDWMEFQRITNTLNVTENAINSDIWYAEAFNSRRCLIIVTGFFTSYIRNGMVYPYYVHLPNEKPFCIAGIYNELDYGFLTTSLIISTADSFTERIENTCNYRPLVIPDRYYEEWLNLSTPIERIKQILEERRGGKFKAHTIEKEFYKNDILYESMLQPVSYKNIMKEVNLFTV